MLPKPFASYPIEAGQAADLDLPGVVTADVYILLAHHDGPGVFSELGAALALCALRKTPKIYVEAEAVPNAMFHYHPAITWCKTVDELLSLL